MTLNLTIYEVCFLQATLETLIGELEELSLSTELEKELLKKIYFISPSTDRKFPELIIKTI